MTYYREALGVLKLFVKLLTNSSDKSSFGFTNLPNIRLATSCTAFMTGYYITGDCPAMV